MSLRAALDFLLHDRLGVAPLLQRARFADHSVETFASALDTFWVRSRRPSGNS